MPVSSEFHKTTAGGRLGFRNLAVNPAEPTDPVAYLLSEPETQQPFVLNGKVYLDSFNCYQETDHYFLGPSKNRFCLFSGVPNDSFSLQQKTENFLNSLNSMGNISSVHQEFSRFNSQINRSKTSPVNGIFGFIFVSEKQETICVIANLGAFACLLRSHSNEVYSLGSNPAIGTNAKKISISTIMLQAGDILLATPDQTNARSQKQLIQELSDNRQKSELVIARQSAQIIRQSIIRSETKVKEVSALAILVRKSSNDLEQRYVTENNFQVPSRFNF